MTTSTNNESCARCGEPLKMGYVQINDENRKLCFDCAIAILGITPEPDEIEEEEES